MLKNEAQLLKELNEVVFMTIEKLIERHCPKEQSSELDANIVLTLAICISRILDHTAFKSQSNKRSMVFFQLISGLILSHRLGQDPDAKELTVEEAKSVIALLKAENIEAQAIELTESVLRGNQ